MNDSVEGQIKMELKTLLLKAVNTVLTVCDCRIIKNTRLYDWQKYPEPGPSYKQSALPREANAYLCQNNHRLQELLSRYAVFNKEVREPLVWTDAYVRPDDILYFRGDNAYVWQMRGPNMNVMAYALTVFYVKSIDRLLFLEKLKEDDYFGNFTFLIDNKLVSRDLLDSIIEIYFLEKHLGLSLSKDKIILDIGAGYGRLAHRMVSAMPNIQSYLCTDAVAASSFISEYYLRFRGVEDKARVVPVDEIENTLMKNTVDIAINIHSFSECRLSTIRWWMDLLVKYRVRYLMIVPNSGKHGGELLLTNDGKDFGKIIEKYGYKLVVREPKYRDPIVQQFAINPTYHYLFQLQ